MYSGRFLLMCDERIIPPFSFVVAALLLFVVVAATTTVRVQKLQKMTSNNKIPKVTCSTCC